MIKNHLLTHCSITPLEALDKYGCFRLAARIAELKADGVNIVKVMVDENGKRYAKYSIGAIK
jgi:hypothetical protein